MLGNKYRFYSFFACLEFDRLVIKVTSKIFVVYVNKSCNVVLIIHCLWGEALFVLVTTDLFRPSSLAGKQALLPLTNSLSR